MEDRLSSRQVAQRVGVPEAQVRLYGRMGALGRRLNNKFVYDFRDMAVLRRCRSLTAEGPSHRRLAAALAALRRATGDEPPLSALALRVEGNRLIASHGDQRWDAETGQRELAFNAHPDESAPVVTMVAPKLAGVTIPGDSPVLNLDPMEDAQRWFEAAVDLEDVDLFQAYHAYLRALACDPEYAEAMINLGRLSATAGHRDRAAAYFRQALRVAPSMPVAHFNLGVTLHDLGDTLGAIKSYRTALIHDPNFGDAHYNLATLLEQQGDRQGALQHMAAYRVAQEREPRPPRR